MNHETRVECPVCGRLVAFAAGVTNAIGEPIMDRHWRADIQAWEWCAASRRSVISATYELLRQSAAAVKRG